MIGAAGGACIMDTKSPTLVADARAQGAEHFAVTGDLANLGLPAEYDAARVWLATLGTTEQVTVVPGNHDIYTARLHGASCLDSWQAYMTSCARGQEVAPSNGVNSFLRHVGPVALIGVNSALPRAPFIAAGRIGGEQLERLASVLDQLGATGQIRVVLIHHAPLPQQAPRQRALDDAAGFEAVIQQHGAELVLHGHNHRDMLAWREWSGKPVPVSGVASGSAAGLHKGEPLARYRLFQIEQRDGKPRIEMVTRGMTEPGGPVTAIDRRLLLPRT